VSKGRESNDRAERRGGRRSKRIEKMKKGER
jgi:hypothetical protein